MLLTEQMKKELEAEYFLFGRRTILGGIIGVFIVTSLISWSSARATLEASSEGEMIRNIKKGSKHATDLIKGNRLLPLGSLLLVDIRAKCPQNYLRIASVGLKTLEDDDGLYQRSLNATRDSTYSEKSKANWDRRIYKVCSSPLE